MRSLKSKWNALNLKTATSFVRASVELKVKYRQDLNSTLSTDVQWVTFNILSAANTHDFFVPSLI